MKRVSRLSVLAASTLFLGCLTLAAQQPESGYWRAASKTAHSITGDVSLSDEKIVINFAGFTMSHIRTLKPEEVSAVFDSDSSTGGNGTLYRLNIPAEKKFLHKNSLCGSEDAQWMAAHVDGRNLQLAFFSGSQPPVFTMNDIANSTNLCGTFSYVR